MDASPPVRRAVRFGVFEVDLEAGELHKSGLKVHLQEQPFQVLALLLERPGEIVPREELIQKLWPEGTFVEFDRSLNIAVNKIREALGDSATSPRFVETVPRRGYRFVAPVEVVGASPAEPEPPVPRPLPRRPRQRALGLAALALVLAGAVWLWLTRSSAPIPETPLVAVPLTSSPGLEHSPSFSPDGNQVAFSWNDQKGGYDDIYVKLIGVGEPVRLTTDPAPDRSPAWSPDGRYIAFLRVLGPGRAELLLIPPIGGAERKLLELQVATSGPNMVTRYLAWSSDAKWLAVTHRGSPNEPRGLFLYSIETEEMRRLTAPPLLPGQPGDTAPAFSPDGRSLAFTRTFSYLRSNLYLLSLSEGLVPQGKPALLASEMGGINGPVWTPDGREIVFSAGSFFANPALWRMAASGEGKPRQLGSIGDNGFGPALSPDGQRLAYAKGIPDANVLRVGLSGPERPAGTPEEVIASTRQDKDARYSPDGRKIAFGSSRSGPSEIWVCDSDGANAVQLTSLGTAGSPSWSPDGRFIAFDSSVEGQWEIYVIRADGGAPRRLTDDPSNDIRPYWSRDGKWIYFTSNRTGEQQVWKVPGSGGTAVRVTRQGGSHAKESVEGEYLFYARGDRLWQMPVGGGEEVQVVGPDLGGPRFDVLAGGLYFVAPPGPDGKFPIQFFSFATGSTRQIATVGYETPLNVSPDGRWILYQEYDLQSDLMLVENFR